MNAPTRTAGRYFDNDRFYPAEFDPEAFDVPYLMRTWGLSQQQAEYVVARNRRSQVWRNSRYQVVIDTVDPIVSTDPTMLHLSIKRVDRQPVHDWREMQEIKNALVGEECEGIELYPAESRRVDTANQYHLWVIDDPIFRFPLGFEDRLVTDKPGGNAVQRPFVHGEYADFDQRR